MAATGLLSSERHRRRTGDGQHIKLALEDVALATMGNLGFIAEAQLGQTRPRVGNYLYGAFGGDFLCSDGKRVMIVALTAKQWSALCEALEMHAEVAELQREIGLDLGLEGNRFLAREQIAALVHLRVSRRPFVEIAGLFSRAGVCWSTYQTVAELVAGDPACSEANPLFAVTEQPGVGRILAPTVPLDFSHAGRMPPRPAPRLGQHTHAVLSQIVGLSDAEIQRLHAARIVAGGPPD
jgi:2-methylfumaryl-CoA isomerase